MDFESADSQIEIKKEPRQLPAGVWVPLNRKRGFNT